MSGDNALEKRVRDLLTDSGAKVFRSGFPDFMCEMTVNGKVIRFGVEVKSDVDELRPAQIAMHAYLESVGFPIQVIRPESKCNSDILRQLNPSSQVSNANTTLEILAASRAEMLQGINKVADIINAPMRGRVVMEPYVRKLLSKYGEEAIIKAVEDAKEMLSQDEVTTEGVAAAYLDKVGAFAAVNYRSERDPLAREVYLFRGVLRKHTDGGIDERIARNLIHELLELNIDRDWLSSQFAQGYRSWGSAKWHIEQMIEDLKMEHRKAKNA